VVGFGALLAQKLDPSQGVEDTGWQRLMRYQHRVSGISRMKYAAGRKPVETSAGLIGPARRNEYNECLSLPRTFPQQRPGDAAPTLQLRGLRWLGEFEPQALKDELVNTPFACHDPGQDALMTSVHSDGRSSEISLEQWRQWTQTEQTQKATDKQRRVVLDETSLEQIQSNWQERSLKTSDLQEYKLAVALRLEQWDSIWKRLWDIRFRRITFRAKRLKQRALDLTAQELVGVMSHRTPRDNKPSRSPKIAFVGDMSLNGSPKGAGPVPSIALREHASKKGLVALIQEFRTSVQCSHCKDEHLQKMHHPKKQVPSWQCKDCDDRFHKDDAADAVCSNGHARGQQWVAEYKTFICSKCQGRVNRDQNAAANMLCIVETYCRTGRRPVYLSRETCRGGMNS